MDKRRPVFSNSRKTSVSIKLWITLFSSCCVFFAVTFYYFPTDLSSVLLASNQERLQSLARKTTTEKNNTIVAIGSSFLHRGVYNDAKMTRYLVDLGLENPSFFRFAAAGATFNRFKDIQQQLLTIKPRLIVIQTSILVFAEPSKYDMYPRLLRYFLKQSFKMLMLSFNVVEWRNFWEKSTTNRFEDIIRHDRITINKNAIESYKQKLPLRNYAGEDELRDLVKFLQAAQRSGVDVVLLKIPRVPVADQLVDYYNAGKFKQVVNFCRTELGISTLLNPTPIEQKYFYDMGHMNEQGRERYSQWLGHALVDYLQGQGD
ncbi:MAG: hypothetical protein GY941_13985 [Planctomycetes bacterium]|nr:hypothetical protein [Planctomycetota bacterium]